MSQEHADTATARIRNAHAREVHPSQVRIGWLDATLNRRTTPTDPNGYTMVLRITYVKPGTLEADLSSDYYITVAADDNTLADAQFISEHADVFGVGIYDPARLKAGRDSATPLAVYVKGQPVMTS